MSKTSYSPFVTINMNLFSYGSLQELETQKYICFHPFRNGTADTLTGYTMEPRPWPMFIPMARRDDQGILPGTLYKGLTSADFERMDHYEGPGYKRLLLALDSGETAYVYVAAHDQ